MTPFWESRDFSEAIVVKSMLEQAGFLVHMDNEHLANAMPYVTFTDGYRLWVPDSDVDAARALVLESLEDALKAEAVEGDPAS